MSDLYINRPGEIWLEVIGREPERHLVPELTYEMLLPLARQIAASTSQGISREHPLLAATLPTGERIQIVVPPATRGDIAISIRRQIISALDLDGLKSADGRFSSCENSISDFDQGGDIAVRLRCAVKARKTILISGGTSSGKTTLLNSLLEEIPQTERLIVVEDTPEVAIHHNNAVGLIAARSALRESDVDTDDLLVAALRMRPDRIILGEIRGRDASRATKTSIVLDLLRREQGATLAELVALTGWLPHTTRAALTGLRKKGHVLEKSTRADATCYRIEAA